MYVTNTRASDAGGVASALLQAAVTRAFADVR
jgi:hypothetical protein